ncbi:unnamed protein product [Rhizoctonia solani]|uniref:Uncharacterized protein n=1 Tax=Rhizoctonia solani TaxID=456999 RepID=A0A8H3DW49_9AGAM|nr:unnamed protein product [Rhizoctonia solani]
MLVRDAKLEPVPEDEDALRPPKSTHMSSSFHKTRRADHPHDQGTVQESCQPIDQVAAQSSQRVQSSLPMNDVDDDIFNAARMWEQVDFDGPVYLHMRFNNDGCYISQIGNTRQGVDWKKLTTTTSGRAGNKERIGRNNNEEAQLDDSDEDSKYGVHHSSPSPFLSFGTPKSRPPIKLHRTRANFWVVFPLFWLVGAFIIISDLHHESCSASYLESQPPSPTAPKNIYELQLKREEMALLRLAELKWAWRCAHAFAIWFALVVIAPLVLVGTGCVRLF